MKKMKVCRHGEAVSTDCFKLKYYCPDCRRRLRKDPQGLKFLIPLFLSIIILGPFIVGAMLLWDKDIGKVIDMPYFIFSGALFLAGVLAMLIHVVVAIFVGSWTTKEYKIDDTATHR